MQKGSRAVVKETVGDGEGGGEEEVEEEEEREEGGDTHKHTWAACNTLTGCMKHHPWRQKIMC